MSRSTARPGGVRQIITSGRESVFRGRRVTSRWQFFDGVAHGNVNLIPDVDKNRISLLLSEPFGFWVSDGSERTWKPYLRTSRTNERRFTFRTEVALVRRPLWSTGNPNARRRRRRRPRATTVLLASTTGRRQTKRRQSSWLPPREREKKQNKNRPRSNRFIYLRFLP